MPRKVVLGVLGIAVLLAASCTIQDRTDRADRAASNRRDIIQPEGIPGLRFFSAAIRSGGLIFLSGQIGAIPGVSPPQLVEGGVAAETRQAMENIVAVLDAAGATVEDLVKCTILLVDIADYDAMNAVYAEFLPARPPARSTMAGSGLALGARVEIECIAAAPAAR